MNEHIDLTKILKDCPEGTQFYCTICGYVTIKVRKPDYFYPIAIYGIRPGFESPSLICRLSKDGKYEEYFDGECVLFPSKEQRDWSKFSAPWYKKEKFDTKTLKPFDRVLVRDTIKHQWKVEFFSHYCSEDGYFPYRCTGSVYRFCIPYNDDTKHLTGTIEEAPEYYRYWED